MKMFYEQNKSSKCFIEKVMTAFEGKRKSVSRWNEGATVASPKLQRCAVKLRSFAISQGHLLKNSPRKFHLSTVKKWQK